MAKKIVGYIKLQVPAGKANPSPPVGPALGQRGLNIMEFCKAFNAQTQKVEPGLPLPVVITAFADKSFSFIIKTPPTTVLIKKAAGIESGSPRPHTDKVGKITRAQAEEIARTKMPDLTAAFENVYRELADELDVRWIEFFMEGIALDDSLMQDDGIHPNAEAQPILLDNAWPIIREALDEHATTSGR